MPYKNPESKRKWEQQNRERRNANRRVQRAEKALVKADTIRPNLSTSKEETSHWKTIGGIALGVGLVALTVFLGLSGLGDLES